MNRLLVQLRRHRRCASRDPGRAARTQWQRGSALLVCLLILFQFSMLSRSHRFHGNEAPEASSAMTSDVATVLARISSREWLAGGETARTTPLWERVGLDTPRTRAAADSAAAPDALSLWHVLMRRLAYAASRRSVGDPA